MDAWRSKIIADFKRLEKLRGWRLTTAAPIPAFPQWGKEQVFESESESEPECESDLDPQPFWLHRGAEGKTDQGRALFEPKASLRGPRFS
jgi:hypothetical protein